MGSFARLGARMRARLLENLSQQEDACVSDGEPTSLLLSECSSNQVSVEEEANVNATVKTSDHTKPLFNTLQSRQTIEPHHPYYRT